MKYEVRGSGKIGQYEAQTAAKAVSMFTVQYPQCRTNAVRVQPVAGEEPIPNILGLMALVRSIHPDPLCICCGQPIGDTKEWLITRHGWWHDACHSNN